MGYPLKEPDTMVGVAMGQPFQRGDNDRIGSHPLPHIEQKAATRFQHAVHLAEGGGTIGEEHGTELANDCIKGLVVEWKLRRIRLAELNTRERRLGGSV